MTRFGEAAAPFATGPTRQVSVPGSLGYTPVMPTFAGQLTEEELQALIEYLKSLNDRP